jgi:hypothetical protein
MYYRTTVDVQPYLPMPCNITANVWLERALKLASLLQILSKNRMYPEMRKSLQAEAMSKWYVA